MFQKIKNKIRDFIRYSVDLDRREILERHKNLSFIQNCHGTSTESYNGEEVIVSLTTHGKRIETVYLAIESIMQQTLKPNRIILWLCKDEFAGKHLPILLTNMQSRGLEIRYCQDFKSYKKLLPTLKEFPNATIITFDDDIIYPQDIIEKLYFTHVEYPMDIVYARGHEITTDENGEIQPYDSWDFETKKSHGINILPTGGAGCLYPPHCFHKDILNWDIIKENCPYADDIWFRTMTLLNNRIARNGYQTKLFWAEFIEIYSSEATLSSYNCQQKGNDIQIKKLLSLYPKIGQIIKSC